MNHNSWLEKAEELRAGLEQLTIGEVQGELRPNVGGRAERERVFIARWLRTEFSNEVPEDTATIALFPDVR